MLVLANSGALRNLRVLLANSTLEIGLYQSDTQPERDSVLSDFAECDFSGYARKVVLPGDWQDPYLDHKQAKSIGPGLAWEFSSGAVENLIFGYFVIDQDTDELVWAERDPRGGFLMADGAQPYVVNLSYSVFGEFGG